MCSFVRRDTRRMGVAFLAEGAVDDCRESGLETTVEDHLPHILKVWTDMRRKQPVRRL